MIEWNETAQSAVFLSHAPLEVCRYTVLDFRRNRRVPNYLGSKQQRRLLVLVALVGVVAILVFQMGDPRQARWLAWNDPPGGVGDPPDRPREVVTSAHDRESPAADDVGESAEKESVVPADRDALFPGVRSDYLSDVEDDTVFRAAESDAWFHLLALLDTTPERQLQKASEGRVGFVQLDRQPEAYRGRLVTIGGVVRSAKLVDAPENGFGVRRYYQLWLQPQRGSPELMVVYALHLPEGFPLGPQLNDACTATGFFFKRWAYQAQGGVTTAPLVLARTVDWQPPPPAPQPPAPVGQQIAWTVLAALIVAVVIVGFFVVRGRAAGRARRRTNDGAAGGLWDFRSDDGAEQASADEG